MGSMAGGGSGTGAGTSGGGSGMGGAGGASGGAAPTCINTGDLNPDCPPVPPITGDCAPKGECCHRSSNIAKEEALGPDEPLDLEYRVQYSATRNHPTTIGVDFLTTSATTRYQNEQQSTLWRFTVPRMGGMQVSGPGKAKIGVGRYNCGEGTYSYYTADAAPVRPNVTDDVTRWIAEEVDTMVDTTATGADRIKIAFADNANRDLTWTPFLSNDGVMFDWELIHQGFYFDTMDVTGPNRDCVGSRVGGTSWNHGGVFIIYTPIADNDSQIITLIQQTYCALVAFGILPEGMKDKSCLETARCVPDGGAFGDGGCDWEKLPDSLCPSTEAEKDLWGCHLGDEMNVNQEPDYPDAATINCTQEAPTAVADPASGASPGQCCDPMGESTTIPPCNAYRLIQDFVAAAAEITDEERTGVQPDCLP
jgi:RES domain-containing protein